MVLTGEKKENMASLSVIGVRTANLSKHNSEN